MCDALLRAECVNDARTFSLTPTVRVRHAHPLMLRRAALGAAFLFASAVVYPAYADDEPGESASAASEQAEAGGVPTSDDGAPTKRVRKRRGKSRRKGGKFAGRVVAE